MNGDGSEVDEAADFRNSKSKHDQMAPPRVA